MGRPQASQGLLGKAALLPRKEGVRVVMGRDVSPRAYRVALNPLKSTDMKSSPDVDAYLFRLWSEVSFFRLIFV
jgi:hypothetical protein